MLRGETGGRWKRPTAAGSRKPGTPLAWAASVLQQSYNHQTTTSLHNPLYVLHRRYWMPQLHTWQSLSMCCENSVRGRSKNSLHQERTRAEWFFSQHILSGCQVCDWGIQCHLYSSTLRVIRLEWCSRQRISDSNLCWWTVCTQESDANYIL